MTAAVDLESDGYSGTYKLIGQSVSLDFANLVSYRGTPKQHDWLKPESNLDIWRAEVGLDANGQDCEHVSVVSLRETLAQVFLAAADGAVPAQSDLDVVSAQAATAWSQSFLRMSPRQTEMEWETEGLCLCGILALDAVRLLTSSTLMSRVRACDECRWVFLDTTRNRSRRWCDPADCGNRSRQRRYYSSSRAVD